MHVLKPFAFVLSFKNQKVKEQKKKGKKVPQEVRSAIFFFGVLFVFSPFELIKQFRLCFLNRSFQLPQNQANFVPKCRKLFVVLTPKMACTLFIDLLSLSQFLSFGIDSPVCDFLIHSYCFLKPFTWWGTTYVRWFIVGSIEAHVDDDSSRPWKTCQMVPKESFLWPCGYIMVACLVSFVLFAVFTRE